VGVESGEARPIQPFVFLVQREEWMDSGICNLEKANPDIFVLERGHTAREAREYCYRCNFRKECLEYGKRTDSVGIWGGEVLGMSNRDEVELTPLVMLTNSRPVENLVDPPELKDYQNPFGMTG
jgi:hypothetical protein